MGLKLKIFCILLFPGIAFSQQSLNDIINRVELSNLVPIEKISWPCLCVPKGHFLILRDRDDMLYHLQDTYNEDCDGNDTLTVDLKNGAIVALYASMSRGSRSTPPQVNCLVERFDFEQAYVVYVEFQDNFSMYKMPYYETSLIYFPVESLDWDVEVIVLDKRREYYETHKSCLDFYE